MSWTEASDTLSSSASISSTSTRTVSMTSSLTGRGVSPLPSALAISRDATLTAILSRKSRTWLIRSSRDLASIFPERRECVFDGVGKFGDSRLLDHAGGAFQRMRKAQDTPNKILVAAAPLEFKHTLVKPLQELASLDTKILVLVLRHLLCSRSRLNESGQFARQPAELRRGLERLVRAHLRLLARLGNLGDCHVDLLDSRGLLFRTELDFSGSLGRGTQ